MTIVPRLFTLAVLILPAAHAAAQTLPWPGDAPQVGAPAPWPGQGGAATPGMPPPIGGGGGSPPCMVEFTQLRGEVVKKGMAAKAAGQRRVPRGEICKLIATYADAEAIWLRFTEAGVQACGIPVQVANQLKQAHANTEQTREKVCAGPLAGNDASAGFPRMRIDDFPHSGDHSTWPSNDALLWFPRGNR